MVEIAQIEKQVLDKYNALKERAVGEFNINMVAHLMGEQIFAQLNTPDYRAVNLAFGPVSVREEITGKPQHTVTGRYNISRETAFDERLLVGSVSKNYDGDVSGTVVLDRTLQVFDELGLNPKITGDAHVVAVRRHGNLNLYVIDEDSGLTAQVMDDSRVPTYPVGVAPLEVRYGEMLEKEQQLSPEEFRDYLARVEKEAAVSGPVFKYDRRLQTLAENAMILYGLVGLTEGLNQVLESGARGDADRQRIKTLEAIAEKVNGRLSAFRESLKQ